MDGFSQSARSAAEKLAEPVQVGSWAWHVPGGDTLFRVQTDAWFVEGDTRAKLTFAQCECRVEVKGRVCGCAHVLRVLQAIRDRAPVEEP